MKQIPLTQGQSAIVDDYWFDYLSQWKWHAVWNSCTKSFYAVRKERFQNGRKNVYMHRVVANTQDGYICDHIHHNTLDNQEKELRNTTPSQSSMNRKIRVDNKYGVAGIYQNPESKNFLAEIHAGRKRVFRKSFSSLEDAVSARQEAEKKYFGEYANQNK